MLHSLIVGLGNPGPEYVRTPHNVGFRVVDSIGEKQSLSWRNEARFSAQLAQAKVDGIEVLLVKPQTFMNLSGEAVGKLLRYYKLPIENLTVISDDADLPIGTLRLRAMGGSGGHRGIGSIIDNCGSRAFARVRVGIGRSSHGGGLADYVLGRLGPEEEKSLQAVENTAAEAVLFIQKHGIAKAMNKYNCEAAK